MTPTYFIILMFCFFGGMAVGHWLHEGYKQDQERKKQERLNRITMESDIQEVQDKYDN